ncbi:beta-galactosidase [Catenovulum sediminis]|uniref:beta-galactosidase n=1 Tax=Catenovulum sediminis TaxID=1740262 RepID=UPI00117F0669|nr:beta-galactosidase [Catenovulum sediminis]
MFNSNKNILAAALTSVLLVACSNQQHAQNNEKILWDFESGAYQSVLKVENGMAKELNQDGNQQLLINFDAKDNHVSGFEFQSEKGWNWQDQGHFAFALDIANSDAASIHVYATVKDKQGKTHNRSFVIPEQSQQTYFIELKGPDLDVETGIRSNPPSWKSDYVPVIWRWGSKNLNLAEIVSIKFSIRGVLEDKSITVDNARLIYPKAIDHNYLNHLVDKFGQSTRVDFVNKIDSQEQLRQISEQEQKTLTMRNFADRSQFNGWKDGPKLKATGFYRTEKYQGKWTLVDPQGYLFFSNGIANVRLANTSTITGYDFDHSLIKAREEGDLTPEDSLGLNRAPKIAWPTREVTSELRANMFSWLPAQSEPLADNFGYRREVHTGAIERGETFSFYRANLQRKYQTRDEEKLMQKWRETTVKRMQSWGFTSFGNWIDTGYYDMQNYPYFANGWIIGDFKTVSSGNDYWSPLPDPFDPVFKQRTDITVKQIASEVKNSPWCVGVFIDNEKSWGMMGSTESQYGIVINTLSRHANESPTKQAFMTHLKAKYTNIAALNKAWSSQMVDWSELEKGVVLDDFSQGMIDDFAQLLTLYAEQYFKVVKQSVDTYMPNHLYMGARFADWGMTPEIRSAAAKYADVVSYNYYKEGINEDFWGFLADIDKPSIIGEFHNGAIDSGLLNPGLIHASSQADRGKKYKEYMLSVIDNPYLVGAHWFQYIDSPLTGRAYDGENYNVGFVSVTDIPYKPLVEAAKEVNKQIYPRRFAN